MSWTYHVGTDEAGYGPTLGPLVITATLWRAPLGHAPDQWYSLLAPEISSSPTNFPRNQPSRQSGKNSADEFPEGNPQPSSLWIADSKKVFSGTNGFQRLERAALALLGQIFQFPCHWRNLVRQLDPAARPWLQAVPWLAAFDRDLPLVCHPAEIDRSAATLSHALSRNDLSLENVRVHFIPAGRFNQMLDHHVKKSNLLSVNTCELVKSVLPESGEMQIWGDKHGGRNRYSVPLRAVFSLFPIRPVRESSSVSEYEIVEHERKLQFCFRARAESNFVVAASSLISKYLREVAMLAFNEFWQRFRPGLQPTAGYPADAKRFLDEILPICEELGIPISLLRRKK